eukprot:3801219-Amphidinium_carterae.1
MGPPPWMRTSHPPRSSMLCPFCAKPALSLKAEELRYICVSRGILSESPFWYEQKCLHTVQPDIIT